MNGKVVLMEKSNGTTGEVMTEVAFCLPQEECWQPQPLKRFLDNLPMPSRNSVMALLLEFFEYDLLEVEYYSFEILSVGEDKYMENSDIEKARNLANSLKNYIEKAGSTVEINEVGPKVHNWDDEERQEGHRDTYYIWDIYIGK